MVDEKYKEKLKLKKALYQQWLQIQGSEYRKSYERVRKEVKKEVTKWENNM